MKKEECSSFFEPDPLHEFVVNLDLSKTFRNGPKGPHKQKPYKFGVCRHMSYNLKKLSF